MGDTFQARRRKLPSKVPADRRSALGDEIHIADYERRKQRPGTVPYSGEVISIYDSRPINSLDFTHTDYPQWNITGAPPTSLQLTSTYTVPGGYVGVLKGYRFEMDPVVPITYADLLLDIFVNGVAQLGYQGLMHGQILDTFVPCFILIPDGGQVQFLWRAPTGIASGVLDVRHLIVEFYGNLLLATGAPLTLEPANKEIGLPVKAQMSETGLAGLARLDQPGPAYRSLTRHRARGKMLFPK